MADPYDSFTVPGQSHPLPIGAPAEHIKAVTPSDTEDLPTTARSLWVGSFGDIKVTAVGSGTETLVGVQGLVQVRAKRVYSTGTTATDIVAWW